MQLAIFRRANKCNVVRLVGAGQPDRDLGLAVFGHNVFRQVETQDIDENVAGAVKIDPAKQGVIHAGRRNAGFGLLIPWRRIAVAETVADVLFLCIELDRVTVRNLKTDALAGVEHLSSWNAFGGDAIGVQILLEPVERRESVHLEGEDINSGAIRLPQDKAMVVALVPGLEIDTTIGIATHFNKSEHIPIELDVLFQI